MIINIIAVSLEKGWNVSRHSFRWFLDASSLSLRWDLLSSLDSGLLDVISWMGESVMASGEGVWRRQGGVIGGRGGAVLSGPSVAGVSGEGLPAPIAGLAVC